MNHIEAPDFASPEFKANPYPFYARLRAEASVYRTRLTFWLPVWLVTRYDDVLSLLKDGRFTSDYAARLPWIPRFVRPFYRNLLTTDDPAHARLRTLVQKGFTPRLVERLRERVQTLCNELLDAVALDGGTELVHAYALPVPLTIIAELLGIPREDRHRFYSWSNSIVATTSADICDVARALPNMWRFVRYFKRLFAQRREHPTDDLVTALVQAEEAGDKLDEEELIATVLVFWSVAMKRRSTSSPVERWGCCRAPTSGTASNGSRKSCNRRSRSFCGTRARRTSPRHASRVKTSRSGRWPFRAAPLCWLYSARRTMTNRSSRIQSGWTSDVSRTGTWPLAWARISASGRRWHA